MVKNFDFDCYSEHDEIGVYDEKSLKSYLNTQIFQENSSKIKIIQKVDRIPFVGFNRTTSMFLIRTKSMAACKAVINFLKSMNWKVYHAESDPIFQFYSSHGIRTWVKVINWKIYRELEHLNRRSEVNKSLVVVVDSVSTCQCKRQQQNGIGSHFINRH